MSSSRALATVMAITGASGAPYAVRLLEALVQAEQRVQLIVSDHGLRLLRTETDVGTVDALRARIGTAAWDANVTLFDDNDRGAAPASASSRLDQALRWRSSRTSSPRPG